MEKDRRITPSSLRKLKKTHHVTEVGLIDDRDPIGGADTACQTSFEQAASQGQIVSVEKPTKIPGVNKATHFRVFPT